MYELRQRNSNLTHYSLQNRKSTISTKCLSTFYQQQDCKQNQITPWDGEQYQVMIKKTIREKNQQKRSQTSTSIKNRVSRSYCRKSSLKTEKQEQKIKQVQSVWSKVLKKTMACEVNLKDELVLGNCRNSKGLQKAKCSTISIVLDTTTNPYLNNTKWLKYKTSKVYTDSSIQIGTNDSKIIADKIDEKSTLPFFFEPANNSNMMKRQKMIMKIRNINRDKLIVKNPLRHS